MATRNGQWNWQDEARKLRHEHDALERIRQAWVEYLGQWVWDWFCTLTFRKELVHPEAAGKASRFWIAKINRRLYGSRWYKKGEGISWVRALEMQRRNVPHYHMLVRGAGVNELLRLYWMDEWEKIAGYARIERPRDANAVREYCTKYVIKGGEIDIGGPMSAPVPSLFDVQSGSTES